MYGEHIPPNVFKEIFQDVQKLFNKKRNKKEDGGRVGYEGGTHPLVPGELTDILQRLKMVTQGEGMYSNWSHANRKSLQRVLTSRANALLGS